MGEGVLQTGLPHHVSKAVSKISFTIQTFELLDLFDSGRFVDCSNWLLTKICDTTLKKKRLQLNNNLKKITFHVSDFTGGPKRNS